MQKTTHTDEEPSLFFLFTTFFKIGCMAFGGFMALVAVIEKVVCEKLRLISSDDILEGISLAGIMPGPTAVNVVSYVGYKIRNWQGAFVCTVAILIPTFVLMLGLSYVYFTYGNTPTLERVFMGILPAIVAIIVCVAIKLAKKKLEVPLDYVVAIVAALVLIFFGNFYTTLLVVATAALSGAFVFRNIYTDKQLLKNKNFKNNFNRNEKNNTQYAALILVLIFIGILVIAYFFPTYKLQELLLTFSGLSVTLFGGGYVMIPMMQDVLVNDYAWVTSKEFADGIALGQVTPGPIMISAAFIGYKLSGISGALVATIGMFTPTAVLMVVASSFLEKISASIHVQAGTRTIKIAAIGMIFAAAFLLGIDVEINVFTVAIFILSMVAILIFEVSVLLIIPIAGVVGFFLAGTI